MERTFSYNTRIDLIKAKGDNKNGTMLMKGVASTPKKDTQGDTLDPSGFELAYFLKNGLINWNHEWKKNPMSIIGKPTSAGVNKEGNLEVDYYLFKGHKMAEEVYALSKAMQENGLSLGLSIEGKVLETDPNDKKKIKRAMITDLAITPHPINLGTTTEIAKSLKLDELIDFEALGDFSIGTDGRIIQKAADTESTDALIPEDLETDTKSEIYKSDDGKEFKDKDELEKAGYIHKCDNGTYSKTKKEKKSEEKLFSKSEFTNLLLNRYKGTTQKQADSVYNYVLNFKKIKMQTENTGTEKKVSDEDFNSALEALSVVKAQTTEVVEGDATEEVVEMASGKELSEMSPEEIAERKSELEKSLAAITALSTEEVVEVVEEVEEEEVEEGEEEEVETAATTEEEVVEPTDQDSLIKGLSTMISGHLEKNKTASDEKFQAVGVLIKGLSDEIEALKGAPLEARTVTTSEYLAKPGEIIKGNETDVLGGTVYSVSKQKNILATKLTDAFLQKSEDPTSNVVEGVRGDLMALEAGSIVTPRLREFAKSEGITILD
jgi:hypothetical protein